jgi:succinate dehydrogenase/fumarate reductase-like Fe-S protein
MESVAIRLYGKRYLVPAELTVQKAMEYIGFQIIRGCGCRGGVCGACAMVYRVPGTYKIKTGLACVTLVQEGMMILNLPYFPSHKALYDIEQLTPTAETVIALYPEIARCMACNTCSKMCHQNIPVIDVVAAALRGNIQQAAELSGQCVMCGLCAARCPAEISPHYIALLCRRLYGKHLVPPYRHVIERLEQITAREYDLEMDKLVQLSEDELKEEYNRAQNDKQLI